MPTTGEGTKDTGDSSSALSSLAVVPFKRRFVLPGVLLGFAELLAIGYPLWTGFDLGSLGADTLLRTALPVCIGAILIWVDQLELTPRYSDAERFSMPMYFMIGVAQCLAMVPGVSRSGATIVSAMLLGADRRSAAEFSFWLAMPTMVGAFAYEAYKSRADLAHGDITTIAVGFVFSFIFGWIVVKTFLRYVQRHTFALFAWWRIVVGTAGVYAIYFM